MTCDLCKTPIQKGEPYSLTEHGRTHSTCLRRAAECELRGPLRPIHDGAGNRLRLDRYDPIFVLQRA